MNHFSRRRMLKLMGMGAAAMTVPQTLLASNDGKKHYITLSFDDGFKKSSLKTAEIYEKYKLSACINVIATAHLPGFILPNEYHNWPVGDFKLWNELQNRGHEIGMHAYKHEDFRALSFEEGKKGILDCIEYFSKNLGGFNPKKSVFNFPFNASTPELEAWLPSQVLAFRTGGPAINKPPHKSQYFLTCDAPATPGNCEEQLDDQIASLLKQPSGWLIFNTHGLDDEGWGPIRSQYLDDLLKRLTAIKTVAIIAAGKALDAVK
jgi:peptidoglycan/xylan/chitin deacetylase (PgdA/CDA1 family)